MAEVFLLAKGDRSLTKLVGFLSSLAKGKAWKVEVSEHRRSRSNEQNNALWGVAYEAIRKASGNDPDDMHEWCCGEYFGWVESEIFGSRKKKPRRTTTKDEHGRRNVLSTTEFMDFYSHIQRRMAEYGIYVPDPGEVTDELAKASSW
jgi:hypothetical protein